VYSCAGHVRQVVSALNLAGWWINHKTTFPILYEVFLFGMTHLMASAQIERDFSAASLVLPSNRGSMDARYFQAQLCALVNFLHFVHPEDISPKSMSTTHHAIECMVTVVSGLFVEIWLLFTLTNMIVL